MKNKIIISSILTIALCLSMIAGSTFALFTSESKVDVSVSSATVSVTATPAELKMGSTLGTPLGEAEADGNALTLENFVPGDYATFKINVKNDSTVAVKYRTVITGEGDLFAGLVVTIDENQFSGRAVTPWTLIGPDDGDAVVEIKVALPESAGNGFQNKSCTLTYKVEAVQGNYVAKVEDADDFASALVNGADTLSLTDDIVFDSVVTLANDVKIDLNGNELSVAGLDVQGETHISGGTIVSTSTTSMQPHVVVKEGATLTLEDVEVEIDDYMNYQAGGNRSYAEFVGVAVEGGTLILDDAHIVVENDVVRTWNYCYGITVTNGTVIMNGGSITVKSAGATISDYATAISSIGNCTVTLNNVEVDAPLLGLVLGTSHLVVNYNNSTFTSTVFDTSMGSGTYELNPVND